MATDVLASYLGALFGRARPSTLVELRWRTAGGMRRQFVCVDALGRVASTIRWLGVGTDVYVGVLPRWRHGGGRADIVGDGRTVWVDLDVPDGLRALEPVDPPPSLVVASGAEGHVHAYWRLRRAVPPRVIERANGRLASRSAATCAPATRRASCARPPRSTTSTTDRSASCAVTGARSRSAR